ncbi:MAG: hypothetical protein ACLP02_01200, partial [Rhodomicrobium sp.]
HLKIGKYDNEYQNVVHAERVFDEIAGQKLNSSLISKLPVNPRIKAKGERNVGRRGPESFPDRDGSRLAIKEAEVEGENSKYKKGEDDPSPRRMLAEHYRHAIPLQNEPGPAFNVRKLRIVAGWRRNAAATFRSDSAQGRLLIWGQAEHKHGI